MWSSFHKKANIASAFSLNLKSNRAITQVKSLRMTSKFELGLYFMMLYPSVKFGWNCCILSKVIDRKPQFSQNLSKKKGHNSAKILQITSTFKFDMYLLMIYPSVKFEWNWCIPSKVWQRGRWRRHNPYVSTMFRRRHKSIHNTCICILRYN